MGGFGAAAGPPPAAGTRHPHGTPSGNAMGRSGREARPGDAAGPRRGFWTCCFSRTQDGARSWRLLSAAAGINRSLPRVGGGRGNSAHSFPSAPPAPPRERYGPLPPLPAPAGIPHPARPEGEGAAPTPAPPPPPMVRSGPRHLSSGGGGGVYAGAILFPPSTVGASALRDGGRLGSLAPWLGRFPSPPQRSAAFAGTPFLRPPVPQWLGPTGRWAPSQGAAGASRFPPRGGGGQRCLPVLGSGAA